VSIEKVYILHHTHVDMGYTDTRRAVEPQLVDMVDRTIDLAVETADRPEPERFRWIHEVSWPVLRYLERPDARREELFRLMREGRVELTALYVNPTDLFDRDTLELSTRYAVDLARAQSLPIDTAMFCDCPGIPWSLPDLLSGMGVRYLSAAPDFIMSYPLEVERPFYWAGPEGGRVLTWFSEWRNSWYAEGIVLGLGEDHGRAARNLLDYIRKIESEGYRWKGLAIHFAMDNVWPKPELMDFVAHWNREVGDIEARMATNHDFFSAMEREHGGEFAVHRAAWPDWWANGNASAAYETACSRRAKVCLRRADRLADCVGRRDDDYREKRKQACEDILLFDEHTWGFHESVEVPWTATSRLEWAVKRAYALSAVVKAEGLERELVQALPRAEEVVVFNPSDEVFSGPVFVEAKGKRRRAPQLAESGSGRKISGQRVPGDDARDCYALTVPPGGTLSFSLAGPSPAPRKVEKVESDGYRLGFDTVSGAITSVHDKRLDRELVDPRAPWGFAELIHERVASRRGRLAMYDVSRGVASPEGKRPRPEFVRVGGDAKSRVVSCVEGPVFSALVTRGGLPKARYEREVRLYHGLPRVDIVCRIDKQVNVDYESLFLALPFAFDTPEVWIENAGAVFRAGVDQLPGSAVDWHSVGEYLAVSSPEATVVVAPRDVPLVHVGGIHTGKWQRRLEVTMGHLYSWVVNNMWFTNFPASQEGKVELAWSLTSVPGRFARAAAERFARAARVGLAAGVFQREAGK